MNKVICNKKGCKEDCYHNKPHYSNYGWCENLDTCLIFKEKCHCVLRRRNK